MATISSSSTHSSTLPHAHSCCMRRYSVPALSSRVCLYAPGDHPPHSTLRCRRKLHAPSVRRREILSAVVLIRPLAQRRPRTSTVRLPVQVLLPRQEAAIANDPLGGHITSNTLEEQQLTDSDARWSHPPGTAPGGARWDCTVESCPLHRIISQLHGKHSRY